MDFDLTDGTAILERTPGVLRTMLGGLPDDWTDATEGPDTWSPRGIVGHLIHGERTDWIPRARAILAGDPARRFPTFDREGHLRKNRDTPLGDLLDLFQRLRQENLATLAAWRLTEAQLALEAQHPELGRVSLRELLATWVAHDLSHLAQAARVMARQYRDAVGPWRQYLPIMDR